MSGGKLCSYILTIALSRNLLNS